MSVLTQTSSNRRARLLIFGRMRAVFCGSDSENSSLSSNVALDGGSQHRGRHDENVAAQNRLDRGDTTPRKSLFEKRV